ncbi:uncharacterized protein LOC113496911 [Trichoplusia ni]|uniref:Uncharacterized protein LOC113496911 n=1 Tax=Trichoplusia ni TaxID=7111 RepID=A0A7E5VVG1_TRINI|nr:uncharacterized protein LOC113496911 [Trichoplusia ni]
MTTKYCTMARIATVFAFMVLLAVVVEGRDWRFKTLNRVKRGFSDFGADSRYSGSNENASVSGERLACGEELGGSYGSGSREVDYNRELKDHRHNRSFSKASATASARASNNHHKANL